ncbi:ABC transporter ATP-binding protein [Halalkalibacter oceani]|uniref:ABC transporter ATP-binding protein n=1 Tax=Halalkalibacter oceani TaxID=1653776 RepID=UPI003392A9E9
MEPVIQVDNVTKGYKGKRILQNVELKINKGETVGIVGPNGSGKSVLFKLIAGFIRADSGDIFIRGEKLGDKFDFPDQMGVLINNPGFITLYSGLKNLQFLADLNKKIDQQKIIDTLELVGLDPHDKTRVSHYSMGMLKKLGIAQAIMEDQDILLFDEPFNALDIKSYKHMKNVLKDLQQNGRTILLTSHQHQDLEELCDSIYMISDTRLLPLTEEMKKEYLHE